MSQFGNSIATASPFQRVAFITTDSNADESFFEIAANDGDRILVISHIIDKPNWTGTSDITYTVEDHNGQPIITEDSDADDVSFGVVVPLTGNYYVRVVVSNAIASELMLSMKYTGSGTNEISNDDDTSYTGDHFVLPPDYVVRQRKIFNDATIIVNQNTRDHLGVPYGTYYAGTGVVSGTLKVEDVLADRRVRLYSKLEGLLLDEVWSDPVTGYFEFNNRATLAEHPGAHYYATGHDYEGVVQSDIADNLLAVAV